MAIIPGGQQIRTNSADADLTNRGGSLFKKLNKVYTMDDIVETVNEGGGSTPYKSVFWRLTQSGDSNPSLTVISNDTDIVVNSQTASTGRLSVFMQTGTFPAPGYAQVICTGFKNGSTNYGTAFGSHGNFSGQTIDISTGYFSEGGSFVRTDLGFGGTNSIIVEVRVFE